ncbi:M23 family metallopeptidase [Rhizorhabdus dicambivorans]|uniref:M23 family peptidase n=1 Tax=Rhizorhabdus dicambivorans TaxID=1850238 RepID=A0A2A4G083_9SPHN|nr:M23 family metallopeptidase [Rhizorhabdus dicambivorans]ATE66648.1 M23 family peptidase [Rhizorhabdus dicambivorans]PCE43868.1 M23 family peptidase [Rhizorhabdus dicambivorans]
MRLLDVVVSALFRTLSISSIRTKAFAAALLLTASGAPALAQDGNLSPNAQAAAQFQAIFQSWKKLDAVQIGNSGGAISIPSIQPIAKFTFTSAYGVRSDPFQGSAAMHAGIDLASPTGTPIYATADGVVDRAEWFGGYGNMVEIEHGKGIATRYGHMSKIVARDGQRVKRGDLIGYVGSTGRSTGSHLHYEVRIDGRAVNPVPFLQSANYVMAANEQAQDVALGGPED